MFGVLIVLLTALAIAVVAAIVSAAILGLGTLLSLVFRVGVFEASLVVTVVGAAVVWAFANAPRVEEAEEEEEEPEERHVWVAPMPLPPMRGARKRHR